MEGQDISTFLQYLELNIKTLRCADAVRNGGRGRPFMKPGCNFSDDIKWVIDQVCHMDEKDIPRMIACVKTVQHDSRTQVGSGKRCNLSGKIVL